MRTRLQEMAVHASQRPEIAFPGSEINFEVHRLRGREQLSGLYEFEVDFFPPIGQDVTAISAEQLIGGPATISFTSAKEPNRFIHGVIGEWSAISIEESHIPNHYRARIVPFLALWNLTVGYRMYQDMSLQDILRDLANQWQVTFVSRLFKDYAIRKYCCQFGESDFNFFSRLLAEEGIFYFFRHELNQYQLVLTDSVSGTDGLDPRQATYDGSITGWSAAYSLRAGQYTVCGFDQSIGDVVSANETTLIPVGNNERFTKTRYLAGVDGKDSARQRARVGIQREEGCQAIHRASSVRSDFAAGCRFELQGHPDHRTDGEYLLTSVTHLFDPEGGYRNSFTCIPSREGVTFQPPMTAAKPAVRGPQTAVVVEESPGPDLDGTVRVRFPWNVEEEQCLCWIRCVEMLAGNERGTWFPPHTGEEVTVEFLNGDPDRPVITGRLYNGANPPPETSPHVTLIRTISGQQLRFDDNSGREELLLQGSKDVRIYAENGEVVVENGAQSKITLSATGVSVTTSARLEIDASTVAVACGMLEVNAGLSKFSGVVQCSTLITNSVVSASYTPGAGNIW